MTPHVCPARSEDVGDFVRLIAMSDKTFLPYLFGKDFEHIVRESFESGEGLFGYPNVRIVEADNRLEGMLLAYTHEQTVAAMAEWDSDDTGDTDDLGTGFKDQDTEAQSASEKTGESGSKHEDTKAQEGMTNDEARMTNSTFDIHVHSSLSGVPGGSSSDSGWVNPGEFYLANMAVFPEFRCQGLGRLLLAGAEARAREKGCTRLALDVEAENRDAIRLYECFGFAREARDLHLMRRFQFQRFSKAVGSA